MLAETDDATELIVYVIKVIFCCLFLSCRVHALTLSLIRFRLLVKIKMPVTIGHCRFTYMNLPKL